MAALKMVKLDFYTIKPQAIVWIVITVVFLIAFSFASPTYDALGIICVLVSLFLISPFQVQEKDSLDRLYGTLSLKQKDIVLGRYISIFSTYILAIVASLVIFAGVSLNRGTAIDPLNLLFGISFSLLLFSLIAGFRTPLNFKFGYTKARYLSFIPLFFLVIIVVVRFLFTAFAFPNALALIFNNQVFLIPLFVLASVILLVLSYRLSIIAYRKRR